MKKLIFLLFIISQFSLAFSASVPKWVKDYEVEFPKEKYIARLGSGTTVENARADALGQIAGFFKSEVVVNTNATSNIKNDGAKTARNQQIEQNVQVVSDMTLTAVEYNQPYYDKKKKSYLVVGYIERSQGWQSVESQVMQQRAKYDSFLELAKKADDPILRFKYLKKAQLTGENLTAVLYMGFLFDPAKRKDYKAFISELNQNYEIETLDSQKIPMFVESKGDWENTITTKIVEVLKNYGFQPYFEKKNAADSVLEIEINSNEKQTDDIVTIFPAVSVTLTNKNGSQIFYTYQNSWGKTVNFSLVQAQKKAFPKIAEEVKMELLADFGEKFF